MKKIIFLLAITLGALPVFSQTSIENFGMAINTRYSEFRPTVSYDGRSIYFTRQGDPENLDNFQAVWYSSVDDEGHWLSPVECSSTINAQKDNSVFWTSADGNKILIRGAYENGKYVGRGFSFCTKTPTGWSPAKKLKIKGYPKISVDYNDGACLSSDEKHLFIYLSSDKNSHLNDIYVSHVNENNEWSYPVKIQEGISLDDYDETAPFLSFDNSTLYFSSDRPGGMGGYDIWMSKRLDDSWMHWSAPVNMGSTVNSAQWESYFSTDANGEYGYVSKNSNGKNSTDIFRIRLKNIPHTVSLWVNIVDANNDPMLNDISVICKEINSNDNNNIMPSNNDNGGAYMLKLNAGKKYCIQIHANGFDDIEDTVDLSNQIFDKEIHRNYFAHNNFVKKTPVTLLSKVWFGFAQSAIVDPNSIKELDKLSETLKANTDLQVSISGYTDNVGTREFNLTLSKQRAIAVKQYLISKGIESTRIMSDGIGESNPIGDNKTFKGRKKNRRVELKISNQ